MFFKLIYKSHLLLYFQTRRLNTQLVTITVVSVTFLHIGTAAYTTAWY